MIFVIERTRANNVFAFDLYAFVLTKDNEMAAVITKVIDLKEKRETQ